MYGVTAIIEKAQTMSGRNTSLLELAALIAAISLAQISAKFAERYTGGR